MAQNYLIKNAEIINEGKIFNSDVLVKNVVVCRVWYRGVSWCINT